MTRRIEGFVLILALLLCSTTAFSASNDAFFAKGTYHFAEWKNKDSIRIRWEYVPDSNQTLHVFRPNQLYIFFHDSLYGTAKLHYTSNNSGTEYSATRVGNTIVFDGRLKGKPTTKTLEINESSWMQSIPFSLGHRITHFAPDSSLQFWVLRADNLSVIKLRADFEAYETITVAGKSTNTIRLRVHPTGLLSYLWHGTYWFRMDGLFVRYQGVNGGPGTPETIIELTDSQ